MTKEDAITLLVAEQAGIVKLDEFRKERALRALNEAVYEIDMAEIARMAEGASAEVHAKQMDAHALRQDARWAEHIADQIDEATERHRVKTPRRNQGLAASGAQRLYAAKPEPGASS